ncbi:hypothetical protein SEA_CAMERICO_88 [Gordonia phage Camerico]|nr:hypothetical protein SEA_CAMERICO_88 [Gordonia phage Camerico]
MSKKPEPAVHFNPAKGSVRKFFNGDVHGQREIFDNSRSKKFTPRRFTIETGPTGLFKKATVYESLISMNNDPLLHRTYQPYEHGNPMPKWLARAVHAIRHTETQKYRYGKMTRKELLLNVRSRGWSKKKAFRGYTTWDTEILRELAFNADSNPDFTFNYAYVSGNDHARIFRMGLVECPRVEASR